MEEKLFAELCDYIKYKSESVKHDPDASYYEEKLLKNVNAVFEKIRM